MADERPWDPEFPVDRALAATLIARLMPALAGQTPIRVGEGWDNDVWRVGSWTFRFPRRPMGVDLIGVEARVLPALAPYLDLPVPVAEHVAEPCALHPAPYVAHRFVPGTTLDQARLDAAGRHRLASQIAGFLRALHAIPRAVLDAVDAPVDGRKRMTPWRIGHIQRSLPALRGTRYAGHLDAIDAAARAASESGIGAPAAWAPCHGDLYARHLLVDDAGDLCGAIDWGDVMISDPGIDLSIAFSLLPVEARPAFWSVYGAASEASLQLARITALFYGCALGRYALDIGDEPLADEAEVAMINGLA